MADLSIWFGESGEAPHHDGEIVIVQSAHLIARKRERGRGGTKLPCLLQGRKTYFFKFPPPPNNAKLELCFV